MVNGEESGFRSKAEADERSEFSELTDQPPEDDNNVGVTTRPSTTKRLTSESSCGAGETIPRTVSSDNLSSAISPDPIQKALRQNFARQLNELDDYLLWKEDEKNNHVAGLTYKTYSTRSLLNMCGSGEQRRFSMGRSSKASTADERDMDHDDNNDNDGGDDDDDDDDDSDDCVEPRFEIIMAIVSSWEGIKTINGYEEALAEQILLRMIELDSHVRDDLGLLSIRSAKFDIVSEKIISVIDGLVSFLGPDLEDFYDKIKDMGHKYRADGFKEYLLAPALVDALKNVVPTDDFPPQIQRDWTTVMNFLVSKMSR